MATVHTGGGKVDGYVNQQNVERGIRWDAVRTL